jgi:hypothetical protein
MAILGGLTPMVAVYTIERSQYDLSPALFADGSGCRFPCCHPWSKRNLQNLTVEHHCSVG